jgi:hypothetical protein
VWKVSEQNNDNAAEYETLRSQAARARALEETLRATLEQRIREVPESLRTLIPDYDDPTQIMAWLNKNAAHLSARRAPDLDAGARSEGGANAHAPSAEYLEGIRKRFKIFTTIR